MNKQIDEKDLNKVSGGIERCYVLAQIVSGRIETKNPDGTFNVMPSSNNLFHVDHLITNVIVESKEIHDSSILAVGDLVEVRLDEANDLPNCIIRKL